MKDIILSIYVPTYNHEKYIAKALESILMQKTVYTYEIIIGDDCSTDDTRKILKIYENRYPGKFKIFYRKENMHKSIINNAGDLRSRCRGKYIIALEGDDYWIDENKIQEQLDFLENNNEYIAVAHNCVVVDDNSQVNAETYPECKDTEYTIKHYVSEILPGQLATVMHKNIFKNNQIDLSLMKQGLQPGDRLLYYLLVTHGKIGCIQKEMSAYRHVTDKGSSFSANYKYDFKQWERWSYAIVEYAMKNLNKTNNVYAELIYFRHILKGFRFKHINTKELIAFIKKIKYKKNVFVMYIMQLVRHHILKRKLWI